MGIPDICNQLADEHAEAPSNPPIVALGEGEGDDIITMLFDDTSTGEDIIMAMRRQAAERRCGRPVSRG